MTEAGPSPARRRLAALKVAGLLVVVGLFASRPHLVADVGRGLAGADPVWLLASVGVVLATKVIVAARTALILRQCDAAMPLGSLTVDVMIAGGLNAVLLIGVGMVYRIRRIDSKVGSMARSAAIVITDRSIGMAAICGGGALALAAWGRHGALAWDPDHLLAAAAVFVLLVIGALIAAPRVLRSLARQMAPILGALRRPRPAAGLLLSGVGTYGGTVLSVYCLARAMGVSAPLSLFAYATPMVTIATIVPVTVGGLGIREVGYMLFLSPLGAADAAGIAIGLAQYATFVVIAGIGFGIRLLTSPDLSPAHADDEGPARPHR